MSEPALWLLRIPTIFRPITDEILERCGAMSPKQLGPDFFLIKTLTPSAIHESEIAKFIRWNLPMDHAWPCNPRKIDGFIEKAAQGLLRKCADRQPQGAFVGQLNPGSPDPYFKHLASNLRGRLLQILPPMPMSRVEDQNPQAESLFVLVGKEGMYAGIHCPQAANGFYPGGSFYVNQDTPETISRAGGKIAEALHYLRLHRSPLAPGSHWLELGACPGGMTAELLARAQRVTALDRAPLDPRLKGRAGLHFVQGEAERFRPPDDTRYDAILSDLNGPPEDSMEHVLRLSAWLKPGALVIFTLKVPQIENLAVPCAAFRKLVKRASTGGLRLFAHTHLTCNRHEFTLFFERME